MKQRSYKGKRLAGWIRALLALFLVGALSFCGLFACVTTSRGSRGSW